MSEELVSVRELVALRDGRGLEFADELALGSQHF
jgi:hypothetical protein